MCSFRAFFILSGLIVSNATWMSKNTARTCLLKKIFCSIKSVTSEIAVTVFLSALKPCCLECTGLDCRALSNSHTQSFSSAFIK